MRLGIDLGGTKIEGVVLDSAGAEVARTRVVAPVGDYDATLVALEDVVRTLEGDRGRIEKIGIGTPGAVSPRTGLMKNANSTWLNGRPLQRDLEIRLGREIRMANDANCFAVSEATDGAAAGARLVFGVIVGTGTGGGIAIDGRPWIGHNAIGGEWGHDPLPWPEPEELPGPPCYCGRRGCIETFLSGPGLARDHEARFGESLSAQEIAERAEGGHPDCRATLEKHAHRTARALAVVINILDPEVIVLGGGLSRISFLYKRVPELWGDFVFSDSVETPLCPPRFGDASGVRGAAWLWPAD